MQKSSHFLLGTLLCSAFLSASAWAQEHRSHRSHRSHESTLRLEFDSQFHHNHHYPRRGDVVTRLPADSLRISLGRHFFFFNSGVWFRPEGTRFAVITPPAGILIPALPLGCTLIWVGKQPYYYANGVYYTTHAESGGYIVAVPPSEMGSVHEAQAHTYSTPTPPSAATLVEPVIYPRNGQSARQTEADRQDCNRWASTQPKAVEPSVFVRAVEACMDARGYTVR